MKKLLPEQEEFAKEIGVTHYYEDAYWKGGGLDEADDYCPYRWDDAEGWVLEPNYADVDDPTTDWILNKIDMSGVDAFSWGDFQLAVERLVSYCNNSSIVCEELDAVEQMMKEMLT